MKKVTQDFTLNEKLYGSSRRNILEGYENHVNRSQAKLAKYMGIPIEARSSGCIVYDETDTAYLAAGGYSVFTAGHCHPKIVEATKAQLEKHPLSTRTLLNAEQVRGAEALASVTPSNLSYVQFTNSGAEAVELGIKLARLHGKHKLIAMKGGYHGKTMGALSITDRPHFQDPFRPLLPEVQFVPFGDLADLKLALAHEGDKACVILEPVQGEGGVKIPPPGYLAQVHALCRSHNAFLILDEIQTGLGRLGHWWGADRDGITPDIMLVGKALSGGVVPVGAVVATPEAFEPLNNDFILHSSTFAGNPLAMAAARSAIEVIQEEDLVTRSRKLGSYLLQTLQEIFQQVSSDLVVDIRGMGLLIGIEFKSSDLAGDFMMKLLDRRVIVSHSLNTHRVVRLTPPATLTESHCNWLFSAIQEAILELDREVIL